MSVVKSLVGNLHGRFFEGNALKPHILLFAAGASLAVPDILLGFESEPTVLTLGVMFVVIFAALLPYQGYDRKTEAIQAFIITYVPSLTFGTMLAGMISSYLVGSDSQSLFTLANLAGVVSAFSVLVGYISTGYMSRDKRLSYFWSLNPPRGISMAAMALADLKEHVLVDQLLVQLFLKRDRLALASNIDAVAALAEMEDLLPLFRDEIDAWCDGSFARADLSQVQEALMSSDVQRIRLSPRISKRKRVRRLPSTAID